MASAKKIIIAFSLLIVLSFFPAVTADSAVSISPSAPYDSDSLACSLIGSSRPDLYSYNWLRNGALSSNTGNVLPASATSAGETWTCKVYYPPTSYTGMIFLGESSVYIKANNAPAISLVSLSEKVSNAASNSHVWTSGFSDFSNAISLQKTRKRVLNFTASATDPDSDPLVYRWYLNDALESSAYHIIREFSDAGAYSLRLEVSDGRAVTSARWNLDVKGETLNGTVYNSTNGLPLAGINLSFYGMAVYNPFDNSGDYSNLQPKSVPDAVTDSSGQYFIYLQDAVYNMVLQGSDEKDFEIYVNASSKKKHDSELNENSSMQSANFNAEGHILYSGKYEHDNKYVCGDKLRFTMFGVNNGGTDETITYLVEDHTSGGGVNGIVKYTADIAVENLTAEAGNKKHKTFLFTIPCSYAAGKYDVHVVWKGGKWHKIGNFFIISDTTSPEVNAEDSKTGFENNQISITYAVNNPAQPDTVRGREFQLASDYNLSGIAVILDKDITEDSNGDGISYNDSDYTLTSAFSEFQINYSRSSHYTARIFAIDQSGNIGEHFTNVTVYANETTADEVAYPVYQQFGLAPIDFHRNFGIVIDSGGISIPLNADRYNDPAEQEGDEYMTPGNGLNGLNGINQTEIDALNFDIYNGIGATHIKPIHPMTSDEYNYTLTSHFYMMKCKNGQLPAGPDCHALNFPPEIWKHSPLSNPTIVSSSSQEFLVNVVDPNNDPFTIYWYDDNQLVGTGSSYTFIANPSLIGVHVIRAVALDSSGMNASIANGPSNSAQWRLTVTAG